MLHRALLTSIALLIAIAAQSQDWQTIHSQDTLYFRTLGKQNQPAGYPPNAIIRAITVDRTTVNASDSIYYFPATWRDTTYSTNRFASNCIDSNAASWMGRMCIHNTNGEELYFNRQSDTFRILTQAQAGDSWTLFDNQHGLTFRATIIAADTIRWGTALDSVKTASIQAFNGTVPASNYANKLLLQWSKSHGWLKTLDIYGFPKPDTSVWEWVGESVDASQHLRLPAELPQRSLNTEDIYTKYQVGNEWTFKSESYSPSSGNTTYVTSYDSVMSVTPVSSTQLKVELLHYLYSITVGPNNHEPGTGTWSIRVTNVQPTTGTIFLKNLYFSDGILNKKVVTPVTQRIYTGTQDFCGNYVAAQTDITPCSLPPRWNSYYGCIKVGCIDGVNMHRNSYLSGFGQISHYYEFNDMYTYRSYQDWSYSYIKLGNCISGSKNIHFTSVPEISVNDFKAFPNPANASLSIELPYANRMMELTLSNSVGQTVLRQQFNGKTGMINVSALPDGLYWLQLAGQQGRAVKKIMVLH